MSTPRRVVLSKETYSRIKSEKRGKNREKKPPKEWRRDAREPSLSLNYAVKFSSFIDEVLVLGHL